MPTTIRPHFIPAFISSILRYGLAMFLFLMLVLLLPSRACAIEYAHLDTAISGQFATTGGLILEKDSPEWYVGQDVYVTYTVSNPTSSPVQNVSFTYAIGGFVPYEYSMESTGNILGLVFGPGRLYATYIGPLATMTFHIKCHVGKTGSNYFQVFYRIPVDSGGTGLTEDNIYFSAWGVEGTPTFSDLALELGGLDEGLPWAEKTTVTLTVRNQGETTATGVTATYVMPSGNLFATLDSVNTTTGLTQVHSGAQLSVSWIIGDIPPGNHVRMDMIMHPNGSESFKIEAVVVASDIDVVPDNNSVEVTVPITSIDRDFELEAHLIANTTQTHWGGYIAYLLSVTNHGPDAATAITVRTPGVDHRLGYKILNHHWAPGSQPHTLSYLQRLQPGETALYAWLDIIQPGYVGNTGQNEKTVSCTVETPWTEANMDNNSASAVVTFASHPTPALTDVSLLPTGVPTYGLFNQTITYTYLLRNNGPWPVTNAYAGFYLPGEGHLASVQCERGMPLVAAQYAQVTGVALGPGEQIPISFNTTPTTSGLMSAFAGTASEIFDSEIGNNYYAGTLPVYVVSGGDLDLVANLQADAQTKYLPSSTRWQVTITGNLNVHNNGGYAIPGEAIPVKYYLSTDTALSTATDTLMGSDEIPAGWTTTSVNRPVNISFVSAAPSLKLYLIAVIDPENVVAETSDANNTSAVYLP